jgi:flagellar biosynthesis protein FlhF
MKVHSFICGSPAEALAQIHEQLGPDAVVLSVRPLPGNGLARLWQKGKGVEVLAGVVEAGKPPAPNDATPAQTAITSGLHFQLGSAARVLPPLYDGTSRPHVFIGPPGAGKTTLLCKWMTRCVLQERRGVKVWRLDGASGNTAEFLNVYCEMLGVTIERLWTPPRTVLRLGQGAFGCSAAEPNDPAADLLLVDLPGVASSDGQAIQELKSQLACLPNPRLHFVLNAAYDLEILREQLRAFAEFNPEDVSLCHLDEQRRPAKVGAFLKGTNCSVRFLSTGQKVPGDFTQMSEVPVGQPAFAG